EEAGDEDITDDAATDEDANGEEANGEEADVDPTLAGLPEEILVAMETADPERGEQLTLTNACIGCHTATPNTMMVGPSWYNIATTAGNRVEGMSAGLYLYDSIIHPNDYVVEG